MNSTFLCKILILNIGCLLHAYVVRRNRHLGLTCPEEGHGKIKNDKSCGELSTILPDQKMLHGPLRFSANRPIKGLRIRNHHHHHAPHYFFFGVVLLIQLLHRFLTTTSACDACPELLQYRQGKVVHTTSIPRS